MKIACSVFVTNRLYSTVSLNKQRRYQKSTLALCKHPNNNEYCMILFSGQDKTGTKYKLQNNIKQVLTKFVNEGKCTFQFKQPEHDIYVTGDVVQLKGFLHLFRRILENKISDKELSVSSMSVMPIKETAQTKLTITKRSDYPLKGFPRTLEELHINDIHRTAVDRGILQLSRLNVLDLSHNDIESIPDELGNLPCLKELYLSHNSLGKNPKQWSWIQKNIVNSLLLLDISHNELKFASCGICKLNKLVTLKLDYNNLTHLPDGIGNMRKLKLLSASHNNLTILPGSIKLLNLDMLDMSNNNFEPQANGQVLSMSSMLPVRSLKEYASRKVLGARIPYYPGILPLSLINHLDNAKFCVCGKACFEIFFRRPQFIFLTNITVSLNRSDNDSTYVPIDCYFCSLKCYRNCSMTRCRNPIVR
ncbi:unnamed protein product [Acanthoscelides obtectus]|uniref:PIF1/LRR1 pleckstrin homology domain-containing protein n=1 Tax=Acanthoscelides obtectus TaxID=200917 RepID=A0A9P0LQU9_ACAOB|nr:unnamed protein product [Acanthoscelides obtectus]CAK1665077.1 Leucine-rich repeat protein 1 [Acanthoscelides obtectus]